MNSNPDKCTGKYVKSDIDNQTYCRKNGSFLKHLRANGYDYQTYHDKFIGKREGCTHCESDATFVPATMSYKDTCGSVACRNKQISAAKQNRTQEQWDSQRSAFRDTMSTKSDVEIQSIIDNRATTYKAKHGIDHRLQDQVDPKSLQLLMNRDWMVEQHIDNKHTAVKIAEILDVGVTTATNWLHRHNIPIQIYRSSQIERDIVSFLSDLDPNLTIITNDRTTIAPDEIDILLPDIGIGIEVNGVYWHGERHGKDRRYHMSKSDRSASAGIRLIHITDSEWILQNDIVKSRLSSMLRVNNRVYARQCVVREMPTREARVFFNENHIQGHSGNICIGLYTANGLVAAMSFGKPRFGGGCEYELIRFCNKLQTTVVGGASKLLSHFVTNYNPRSIISYSDNRWNTGGLYSVLGFKHTHDSPPNYKYFKTSKPLILHGRYSFQKHKLSTKLDHFDPQMSEWENMKENGYDRIWDCGNGTYKWGTYD